MLPAGKYHARGFVVGELDVEGVDFFFNDWVTDDQPLHIAKIDGLAVENGVPFLSVHLAGNEAASILCDGSGNVVTSGAPHAQHSDCQPIALPELVDPIACASGRDGTQWIVDRVAKGSAETEVEQFSAAKEFLRRLSVPATDPQPRSIAASKDADTIFLLEENNSVQRVRGLTLQATKNDHGESSSDWKVDFEKSIVAHKNFLIENGQPVLTGGKAPSEKAVIKLMANPLQKNEKPNVEVTAGFDASGSFLKTTDGLPLESISDTPHLQRIVLSPRAPNVLDVFQDDDAVVEQFRISALDQMMAFDCGEIELK